MILYKVQKRFEIPVVGNTENAIDMAALMMRRVLRDSVDLRKGDLLRIDIRILVDAERDDNDRFVQKTI